MRRTILLLAGGMAFAVLSQAASASGFGTYFARLSGSGGVVKSSGVADGARTATGVYEITFNRAVNYCGYVATVTGANAGYATIDIVTSKVLTVSTYSIKGAKANLPFNVMVSCAP